MREVLLEQSIHRATEIDEPEIPGGDFGTPVLTTDRPAGSSVTPEDKSSNMVLLTYATLPRKDPPNEALFDSPHWGKNHGSVRNSPKTVCKNKRFPADVKDPPRKHTIIK